MAYGKLDPISQLADEYLPGYEGDNFGIEDRRQRRFAAALEREQAAKERRAQEQFEFDLPLSLERVRDSPNDRVHHSIFPSSFDPRTARNPDLASLRSNAWRQNVGVLQSPRLPITSHAWAQNHAPPRVGLFQHVANMRRELRHLSSRGIAKELVPKSNSPITTATSSDSRMARRRSLRVPTGGV